MRNRILVPLLTTLLVWGGIATAPSSAGTADATPSFPDVPPSDTFHDDIAWIADHGFVTGYTDGTYRPATMLTGQVVLVVLWRMSGSPIDTHGSGHHAFDPPPWTDIDDSHPFYTAFAWAAHEELPVTDGDILDPTAPMTRRDLVRILHSLSGMSHRSYGSLPFSDTPPGGPDDMALRWGYAIGLVDGYGDNTFRPEAELTRQLVAGFDHRFHLIHGGVWPVGAHDHGASCDDPITPAQQMAADRLVEDVETSLRRWAELDQAIADGFRYIAPPFGGAGAHYLNNGFMTDGHIVDPLRPESLMYDGDTLQGAMFLMEEVGASGPMIGGCLTPWHIHDNLCYSGEPNVDGQVVGLSDLTGCGGDSLVRVTPEMLHVWIIDHPDGPFAGLET